MTTEQFDPARRCVGSPHVPGDKSISHRAVMLSMLASGKSRIAGLSDGEDVACSLAISEMLGASVRRDGAEIEIHGPERLSQPQQQLDCGNSGTSMRLYAGICGSYPIATTFIGDASLSKRPMERIALPLEEMGAMIEWHTEQHFAPFTVHGGRLKGVRYELPVASAQVKSAVLLAGLRADSETIVVEQTPTRAHTEEMLAEAGADVSVDRISKEVSVRPSRVSPMSWSVPADPSQAAFWIVAALIAPEGEVVIENVYTSPERFGIWGVLERMGANISRTGSLSNSVVTAKGSQLRGAMVTADEVVSLIDEVPILSLAMACAEGDSSIDGLAELRVKESDRLTHTASLLTELGAQIEVVGDGLRISGVEKLRGGSVDADNDHRLAMTAAVSSFRSASPVVINGWGAVETSYPNFREEWAKCQS